MYAKLILRNVKRSAKDYLIYIVTLTILCCTFLRLFIHYKPLLSSSGGGGIRFHRAGRQHETGHPFHHAAHPVSDPLREQLHAPPQTKGVRRAVRTRHGTAYHSRLFFAETFLLGGVCTCAGILLGMFGSQLITALLLSQYDLPFRLSFMLFPDTALLTLCFFALSLLVIGLFNVRTLRRIKIIDMLAADRINDSQLGKSRYMPVVTVLHSVFLLITVLSGISNMRYYFDPRSAACAGDVLRGSFSHRRLPLSGP